MIAVQAQWQETMDTIGSLEMVDDEFAALRKTGRLTGPEIGPLHDKIELDNVSFSYADDEDYALRALNITIPANTTVAFVGESGAGKSTLIDMLALLLRPQHGQVRIDGVPGDEIELNSWRSQIGYVSQETVMFDDTVANNICLWRGDVGSDPEVQAKVEEAARKAYAHHFIEDLPDGYNTVIGDRGIRLSGGQRQRLFIARELFKNPNLLLLDEATSALDTESERYIQESIDALKGRDDRCHHCAPPVYRTRRRLPVRSGGRPRGGGGVLQSPHHQRPDALSGDGGDAKSVGWFTAMTIARASSGVFNRMMNV